MEADNSSIAKRFEPGQCVELRAAPPIFPANEGAISASARGAWPGWQAGQLTANSTIHLLLLRVTPSLPPYLLPCPPPSPSLPHSLTSSLPLSPSPAHLPLPPSLPLSLHLSLSPHPPNLSQARTNALPTHPPIPNAQPPNQPNWTNPTFPLSSSKKWTSKNACSLPQFIGFSRCALLNSIAMNIILHFILFYTILYYILFCFVFKLCYIKLFILYYIVLYYIYYTLFKLHYIFVVTSLGGET